MIILILSLLSCSNDSNKHAYQGFSKDELQFIAGYDHELLLSTRYMEKSHQEKVFIAQILPQVLITRFYLEQQCQVLEILMSEDSTIENSQSRSVDIQYTAIDYPGSIVEVRSKYVVPHVYTNVIDLKHLALKDKKEKLIDMLLPSVLTAVHGLAQAALETRDGKPVYVKKYGDLSSSIIDYYKVIAKGPYDEYPHNAG